MVIKKLSLLLIVIGILLSGWSGYEWWSQKNAATFEPKKAQAISKDWKDTDYQKTVNREVVQTSDVISSKAPLDFKIGEEIGELTIPALGYLYPIYWGTDEQTLKQGVGMYDTDFTTLPEEAGHTALAGHRDTVFDGLDQLKNGDRLYVTLDDTTYEYQIRKTWITDEQDRSVIVEKNSPTLTLTTCYPFDYLGSAPDRYIIQASLIQIDDGSDSPS
ncbi:class D sortase [Bacillus sp. RAR_GA_16]|uniref:class D sortase n=1 Tax=Bacillus sp. RAR_GA_16 TaxID=2876774 RepID=UPI001CCB278E|nr:class D sortase [Bacillus sp. RAR_GA_16]MCA0173895.1 class D sortase [Bacillus sp. RAR_GA_16]